MNSTDCATGSGGVLSWGRVPVATTVLDPVLLAGNRPSVPEIGGPQWPGSARPFLAGVSSECDVAGTASGVHPTCDFRLTARCRDTCRCNEFGSCTHVVWSDVTAGLHSDAPRTNPNAIAPGPRVCTLDYSPGGAAIELPVVACAMTSGFSRSPICNAAVGFKSCSGTCTG